MDWEEHCLAAVHRAAHIRKSMDWEEHCLAAVYRAYKHSWSHLREHPLHAGPKTKRGSWGVSDATNSYDDGCPVIDVTGARMPCNLEPSTTVNEGFAT